MKSESKKISVFVLVGIIYFSNSFAQDTVYIDHDIEYQYIDGFGASTAWHGQINDIQADVAFGNANNNQLGLSILRIRIDPGDNWGDELANAQKAVDRGAIILASPWSPPASMKTNSNTTGGELSSSEYANYAAWLSNFKDYMLDGGAPIDIISLQNEPNISVDYESCDWTPQQLLSFCRDHAQNIGGSIMMPEAFNFDTTYSDQVLRDSIANSHIDFIGGHIYGASPFTYTTAVDSGKRVWMTEHFLDPDDIGTCMIMGKEILDCMYHNMSAYVWWYLRQPGCNIINTNGSIKKKGHTLGQFSKFIRPGYHRIEASYNPQAAMYVAAFEGDESVITVVYRNPAPTSQVFTLQNSAVTRVKRYTTSETKGITNEGTIELVNGSFTASFGPKTITTFVSTIDEACVQTLLTSKLRVDDGEWLDTNKITITAGSNIIISPEADGEGTWSWSGCGTSGSSNEQNITPSSSCSAIATYTNSCGAQTLAQFDITVLPVNSLTNNVEEPIIQYFPNPASSGIFTITIDEPNIESAFTLQIYNVNGKQVFKQEVLESTSDINAGLQPGLYIMKLVGNGSILSGKLLVN